MAPGQPQTAIQPQQMFQYQCHTSQASTAWPEAAVDIHSSDDGLLEEEFDATELKQSVLFPFACSSEICNALAITPCLLRLSNFVTTILNKAAALRLLLAILSCLTTS